MSDIKLIDIGNVGDFAKPACILIEKVSYALGAPFIPWQMKRIAQAEAEADLIKAEGEVKKNGSMKNRVGNQTLICRTKNKSY